MDLQIFNYHSKEDGEISNDIRTAKINGEIWFVGVDIARALGYKRATDTVRQQCKKGGTIIRSTPSSSGIQEMILINEPNVYRLIVKSKLPSAEKFESWVFNEVLPSIRKNGFYGHKNPQELPNFILRYRENMQEIPNDYFSVISEMFVRLYSSLEKCGYVIPDTASNGKQIMPDISVGGGFAKFLRANDSEFFDKHKKHNHKFPDGRVVQANMYHIDALPIFIKYIHNEWIPERAEKYFKERDLNALQYLPKLLKTA